jgi:hypothetical protein
MKKTFLYLFVLCGSASITYGQTSYIENQSASAQNANAWITGKFAAGFMQTFRGTSSGTTGASHHDFFGGSATPAATNMR